MAIDMAYVVQNKDGKFVYARYGSCSESTNITNNNL